MLMVIRDAVIESELLIWQKHHSEWNSHRIRHSNMAETPSGIPNVIFDFPELQGYS